MRKASEIDMWWVAIGLLLLVWLVGLTTSTTFGGFIHLLLLAAILITAVRVQSLRDRRGRTGEA